VSYPNAADRARARRLHVRPGGEIMIHGTPNRWRGLRVVFAHTDWTKGCIAVSDSDIEEIWRLVPNGSRRNPAVSAWRLTSLRQQA